MAERTSGLGACGDTDPHEHTPVIGRGPFLMALGEVNEQMLLGGQHRFSAWWHRWAHDGFGRSVVTSALVLHDVMPDKLAAGRWHTMRTYGTRGGSHELFTVYPL